MRGYIYRYYVTGDFRISGNVFCRHPGHTSSWRDNLPGLQVAEGIVGYKHLRGDRVSIPHQGAGIRIQHEADDGSHGDRARCRSTRAYRDIPAGNQEGPHKPRQQIRQQCTGPCTDKQDSRPQWRGGRKRNAERNHRGMPQNV